MITIRKCELCDALHSTIVEEPGGTRKLCLACLDDLEQLKDARRWGT